MASATMDAMNLHLRFVWGLLIPDALTDESGHLELSPDMSTTSQLIGAEIITVIRLPNASHTSVDLVLDTDAAGHQRRPNWRATVLARVLGWAGDGLLGPALFLGVDGEGEPTDVPDMSRLYHQLTGQRIHGRVSERQWRGH